MRVVVDTSSFISLGALDILNESTEIAEVITSNVVVDELKEMSAFDNATSDIAHAVLKLIEAGRIRVVDVTKESYEKYISRGVDSGEGSCFFICINEGVPMLITDDVDAAYYLYSLAKLKGIEIRISIAFLVELVKLGKLGAEEAEKRVAILINKRGWEGGVLEVLSERYLSLLK